MIDIIDLQEHKSLELADYAADAKFVSAVSDFQAAARRIKPKLEGRTIWMVNSTARGGGVSEMLPRMISLMRDMGISINWAVINTKEKKFFALTKTIHNALHDNGGSSHSFSADDARLYEAVNRENADSLIPRLKPHDIVIVHDPQPLPLGQMVSRALPLTTIWRCHIGLDRVTPTTRAAWEFLRPYLSDFQRTVFSLPEYIPSFLAGAASIIPPAIDPLSHKNRDLSVNKMIGILCNSGLQKDHEPVATPPFARQVMRVSPSGEAEHPGELGLLFRPVICQISRWDRLKGWLPLIQGFIRMKENFFNGSADNLEERNKKRVALSRLVLAGPDPSSISDDPEGLEVIEEIKNCYKKLPPGHQKDVAVLMLPMASRKENALAVNALQQCATIVVQNSIQEGFGLTVTEAMWKRKAVLGSSACGIRMQIRDGVDGALVANPEDAGDIAQALHGMLTDPRGRYLMGRSAQRRVYDEFLVFRQLSRYFQLLHDLLP